MEETVTPGKNFLPFLFLFWTTGQQGRKRLLVVAADDGVMP